MSLIENAALRLKELRTVGIEATTQEPPAAPVAAPVARIAPVPVPVHAVAPPPPSRKVPTARPPVRIDLERLHAAGFITPDAPRSRIANEFRIVKRPLIANIGADGPDNRNLIMVTSSVPGEGKTFASVNLAMSIAMELDRTVLLVDADTARPALPTALGIPNSLGLLDLLDGTASDLGEAIVRTNVDKLSFLSCGRQRRHDSELLASEAMTRLLEELSSRYSDRIVIFDSPPLLVTTEARVLAARMGQILFVVRAETTLQSEVRQALATIESCPIKLQLLNAATASAQGIYGYGYGYEE